MLASEFFSAWYMGRNPTHEIIFASYAQDRSDDVGKAVRDIMLSETHEQVFPESKLRIDAKGTRKFQTIQDGTFFTTSWKGATTGRGANCATKDTIVETVDGPMTIEKIHYLIHKPLALSLDHSGKICYARIKCSLKTNEAIVYEIKTRAGRRICATADHRIYSRLRGFIELKDIRVGEEILCRTPDFQTRQTFDFKMRKMQRAFHAFKLRCSKGNTEGLYRHLLFGDLFGTRSCDKKQTQMSIMQRTFAKINWRETIFGKILSRMSCKSYFKNQWLDGCLQRMWRNIYSQRLTKNFLQSKMHICPLFKERIPKRTFISNIVQRNISINKRTRWELLCCLWKTGKDKFLPQHTKNQYDDSPYRHHSNEQCPREFGDTLSELPLGCTSLEFDTVSMAPRLCENKVAVYDLQIEETHNYFTAGILSHNCLILDDLIKDREDAQSDVNRRKREEWFSSSGYTRLMSDEGSPEGRILLIMTRWAYDDIAAYLLNQLAHEHWHILNCPAIAEEKDILGRLPGDALWPERYPISRLENVKKSVISTDWTALYQQRPLPKEGGMWKLYWFKEYNTHHLRRIEDLSKDRQELPEELKWFDRIVMSVDTAYKPEQMNDPSCITVWGYSKNRQYLIEVLKEKLEYPELKRWIERTHEKYTEWNMGPVPVLIEDSASGQSLIQDYKVSEYRMPVIKITSIKSKVVRAEHASGYAESGNIILPERAPWKTDFESEFAQFPFGSHDDQVDSVCQYINWFYKPKKKRKSGKIYVK